MNFIVYWTWLESQSVFARILILCIQPLIDNQSLLAYCVRMTLYHLTYVHTQRSIRYTHTHCCHRYTAMVKKNDHPLCVRTYVEIISVPLIQQLGFSILLQYQCSCQTVLQPLPHSSCCYRYCSVLSFQGTTMYVRIAHSIALNMILNYITQLHTRSGTLAEAETEKYAA